MMTLLFSDKVILVAVTVIGMAMCSAGIGQVAARGDWLHPLSIAGYVLGIVILAIVVAALMGFELPWIDSPRMALVAVIVLAIVKVAITQLHRVLVS